MLQDREYRELFDAVPGQLLVLDSDLRIVAVTEAYLSATLTRRSDILGRLLFDVFPDNPEDDSATGVDNLRASLNLVQKEKKPHSMAVQKYDIQLPDGSGFEERYWSPRNIPILDRQGNVKLIIHRVEDVTDFMRLQQSVTVSRAILTDEDYTAADVVSRAQEIQLLNKELAEAKEVAERANSAKSEFLSRMSHELRTPLNAVLGFAQILEMQEPSPLVQEATRSIINAGNHLLKLINEVLDLSKIEVDKLSLSVEIVSLTSVLEEVSDLLSPLARKADVHLSILRSNEPCYVTADRQRLIQVFVNVVNNAIKYNRKGGKVTLTTIQQEDGVRVFVQDEGVGIAETDRKLLFLPFSRIGDSGVEGTGLGLVLTQKLLSLMDGNINLLNSSPNGSVFEISLKAAKNVVEQPKEPVGTISDTWDPRASGRVLYIEDNLANMRILQIAFRHCPGLRLMPAMQGTIGLSLAEEHQPDLILLDLHLPDIDGEDVLRQLKANPATSRIPVIVITADVTQTRPSRIKNLYASALLTKPVDLRALGTLISQHLSPNKKAL